MKKIKQIKRIIFVILFPIFISTLNHFIGNQFIKYLISNTTHVSGSELINDKSLLTPYVLELFNLSIIWLIKFIDTFPILFVIIASLIINCGYIFLIKSLKFYNLKKEGEILVNFH